MLAPLVRSGFIRKPSPRGHERHVPQDCCADQQSLAPGSAVLVGDPERRDRQHEVHRGGKNLGNGLIACVFAARRAFSESATALPPKVTTTAAMVKPPVISAMSSSLTVQACRKRARYHVCSSGVVCIVGATGLDPIAAAPNPAVTWGTTSILVPPRQPRRDWPDVPPRLLARRFRVRPPRPLAWFRLLTPGVPRPRACRPAG
jgi:hypothetical protein